MTQPLPPVSRRALLLAGAGAALSASPIARGQATRPSLSEAGEAAGRQGAGFYRTTAGGMTVTLVTDGQFGLSPLHPGLGADRPAEEVMAAARDFHVPDDVPAHVHCLLIESPDGLVLVDAGCGPLFGDGAGKLVDYLAGAGVKPEDIDAVLLTHAHPDHVGGLIAGLPEAGGRATFPNATVFVSDAERDNWLKNPPSFEGELAMFVTAAQNALNGVKLESMGRSPARGITAVPLPGHTPGHVGLRIGDGADALLYVGDTLMFLPILAVHPEWHVAFDQDPAEGAATRRRLFEQLAADGTRLAGPHVPFPGFGHLRRRESGGYEFLPETWRWQPAAAG